MSRREAPAVAGQSLPARDWDARSYERVSGPQAAWAETVLDRLALRGNEAVLDAGCGSGRVTKMLLERLPEGRVVAVDSAPSMVAEARDAVDPGRATVIEADLVELTLDEPLDAVFSNAVFHWVPDHEALFARLFVALRPGGRLEAQCGGEGNVERFHEAAREVGECEPYAAHLAGWMGPWNFAGPGFEAVETGLEPWPVTLEEPVEYLRTVCLGHHLERLPEELHEPAAPSSTRRRATSYLGIAVAVVIGGAFVDETKSVVTYVAIFGAIGLAIGAIAGIVLGERRERRHPGS